jgi:lysophospholipase L1-like esterase
MIALLVSGCGSRAAHPSEAPLTPSPATTAKASASADWILVAFGDSIAKEAAAEGSSYPELYARSVEELTERGVSLTDLADGSTTTESMLASLADVEVTKSVANADIITITAGGNDVDPFAAYPDGTCTASQAAADCLAAYNPDFEARYRQILTRIVALRQGRPTIIRVTSPDYNPFIGWDQAPSDTFGVDFYRQVAAAETEVVCRVAPEFGAACADFLTLFNGKDGTADAAHYLTADHAHPDITGRQLIVDTLVATGLTPLQ